MTERVNAGVALLCHRLKLNCMKIEMSKRPRNNGGKLLYPYKVDRGGIATILISLPIEGRSSSYLNETEILYEVGDKLNGKSLWGCTDKPNRTRRREVGTSAIRSGRHSRQGIEISGEPCYAIVVSSWDGKTLEELPADYVKRKEIQQEE